MKLFFKYLSTSLIVVAAAVLVAWKYWDFIINPWTRDGQVRAEVIQITPRVSGPIVQLAIQDNQFVKADDLLFEIDPRTFEASLDQAKAQYDKARDTYQAQVKQVEAAKAQVEIAKASLQQAESEIKELDSQIVKNEAEYGRQQEMLPQRATSQKSVERSQANYEIALEKKQGALAGVTLARASLLQAEASLAEAQANLGAPGAANASIRTAKAAVRQAELNLEFTKIRAPLDGYVTNLNLRLGSNAAANQPALALVDINSYWVAGFFKETSVGHMRQGNKATITLMTYPNQPLEGYVDSLGWGISQQDGSTGFELLPTISPTFEWIRLAQRVPVRIHLQEVPENIALRVGTTASVLVRTHSDQTNTASQPAPASGVRQ